MAKGLQRAAKRYGEDRVERWIDEGVPVTMMGKVRDMEQFRERQSERPPDVPTDVEQRNEASLHRNRKAQHDTEPAGRTGVPDSVREVFSSPGTQLDGDVKSGLEERLGTSLDHVQVHTGPSAQQACEQVNARAFAVGNHIAFGPGEYDPSSAEGQHLIAHEVVHTLQQPDADISMMPKTQPDLKVDPDPDAEREAKEAAERVVHGKDVGLYSMYSTDVHVQRSKDLPETDHGSVDASSTSNEVDFPDRQLQKKFKHAKRFGVDGNWNNENKRRFEQALQDHIADPETVEIEGTYRGEKVIHYYNPRTGNNVITTQSNEFISGWKLSKKQAEYLRKEGDL